jgi:hypothetical protein
LGKKKEERAGKKSEVKCLAVVHTIIREKKSHEERKKLEGKKKESV